MKAWVQVVAVLMIVCLHESASAQTSDPGRELVDLFADMCFSRFPDDAALTEGAAKRQLAAMSQDQVKRYLHSDPGHGWLLKTADGLYAITIEDPPYHACAVRRFYGTVPNFELPYQSQLSTWAAKNHIGPLTSFPPQSQVENGYSIHADMKGVTGPDGKPQQLFMEIVTTYTGGQIEVRLVRQIPQK